MTTLPVTYRLTVDTENAAETFWDAMRASDILTPGSLEKVEDAIDRDGFVFVDETTMKEIESIDGWDDGPDYAPTALVVERLDGADLNTTASPLAIARMTALARAYNHGWAQGFDRYYPPSTMVQVLAAYDAAQAADDQHRIVIPSLVHESGSGRTKWRIADDGAVTATIYAPEFYGEGRSDYDLVERVTITVAPDGAHVLIQLQGCDIEDLDRACRVWRAVRNVVLRPEPTQDDFTPEIVHRISRPDPAEEVMIVVNH